MIKQLKFYFPQMTMVAILFAFINIFFGFLDAGTMNSLFGTTTTLFNLMFSGTSYTPLALLSFVFNLLGIISAYFAFLFYNMKKKQWNLAFLPASISLFCFVVCIVLIAFIPLGEDLVSFGIALILNEVFLSLSAILMGTTVLLRFLR